MKLINSLPKKLLIRIIFATIFAVIIFGVGYVAGVAMNGNNFATDGKVESSILSSVKSEIDEKFVFWKASSTEPMDKDFEYGIVKGYVETLKDPYTIFFPPKEAKSFTENVTGSFGGVGMNVGSKDGHITIISPLKDSPAQKAGIKAGDIVVAVEDKDVTSLNVDDVVSMIRGPVDSKVKISVIHKGETSISPIFIFRKEIKIPTVDTTNKNGVFVISLYNFSSDSAEQFRQALLKFVDSKSKYLLLDLRGNPGGYLDSAVEMASFFLPEGKIVVSEKQGKIEKVVNHRSKGYDFFKDKKLKMSVLIDGGSASASEILTGALKDYNIAKVIGEKSFGKGSVQELINFNDGSALKVTIAKWYTPNGISISENGIKPDVEILQATSTPKKDKKGELIDVQLNKAIEYTKAMK